MNPVTVKSPPKTRIQAFCESPEKVQWIREMMESPIGKDVMAILDEAAEPHDDTLAAIVKEQGANAMNAIALIHAAQAGQRRVIRTLKAISSPREELVPSIMARPPFEHIDESYLEQK
jgi:hypothetical protein